MALGVWSWGHEWAWELHGPSCSALKDSMSVIARRQMALKEPQQFLESKVLSSIRTGCHGPARFGNRDSNFDQGSLTVNGKEVGLFVYNAAYPPFGPFSHSLDEQISVVKINVESITRAAHAFVDSVQAHRRGSSGLILMSSTRGETELLMYLHMRLPKPTTPFLPMVLLQNTRISVWMCWLCIAGPINTLN
jgi:hypothetical protein